MTGLLLQLKDFCVWGICCVPWELCWFFGIFAAAIGNLGKWGFHLRGGGGLIEPPKTGGLGKRAQLTDANNQ